MNPKYLEYGERVPDTQYKELLSKILDEGEITKNPYQTMSRRVVLTLPPMIFRLENGFPIITERRVGFWRKPIGELLAFIHGVRDANNLADVWGANWWREQWATPEKCADFGLEAYDLGPGSYGGALEYVLPGGRVFNQYKELMLQLRDKPDVVTHKVTTWLPHHVLSNKMRQRKVVVAPCHGDVEITIMNKRLTLRMDQRSADFPIGVPSNIIQYAALTIMIAHVLGYEPYMFIHATHNSQIYEDQVAMVRELVTRKTHPFPSLYLTEEGQKVTDLFDFRPSHFELRDYTSEPAMKEIPVTT
ncbi:MAG: thymidylate synthase [Minisyncoccia bacterium]